MDEVLQAYNRLGVKRYVVRGNDEFNIMMSVVPTIFHDITEDDCNYVSYLMQVPEDEVSDEIIRETEVTGVDAIKQLYIILDVLISHIHMNKVKDNNTYQYMRENYPLYYLADTLRISREKILKYRMSKLNFISVGDVI